ncbi:MAG: hypothetical protein ABIU63_05100 [Chitinophagaceae bacterium]
MRPTNFTDRKKRIITFAGLYVGSIILLFFIFSAFGVRFSVNDQQSAGSAAFAGAAPDMEFIQTDSALHAALHALQLSDARYSLLPDTVSLQVKKMTMDAIINNEKDLKNSIDSIDILTASGTGNGRGLMYQNMLSSFRAALNERQALKNIQGMIAAGKTPFSTGQQNMLQWKDEISRKEDEISRLGMQLKAYQSGSVLASSAGASEADKGEIELLKTAFTTQQNEYAALKSNFTQLKSDNNQLSAQIVQLRKSPVVPAERAPAADNKVNELEQQLQTMNADLYFARIDCNMARADAQQIISNARQRKELLSESLAMLSNLSKSDDAAIQKKAKEKITRLNRIANTLHD